MKVIQPATNDLPNWGFPQTVAARRAYREMIVTTPGLGECISGAILYDETIRQQKNQPALELCQGEEDQMFEAHQVLYHRARFNRAAHAVKYTATVEKNMHAATKYPGAGESCGIANTEE